MVNVAKVYQYNSAEGFSEHFGRAWSSIMRTMLLCYLNLILISYSHSPFYVINIFKLLQCVLMGTGVWGSCLLVCSAD